MGNQVSLITLIASAGEPELHQVDARINQLKAEIAKFVDSRKAELARLQMVRKILDRKVHPKQKAERKPADPDAKKNVGSDLANEIYDLISAEGSMPSAVIAKKLGRSAAAVGACAWRSAWFESKNGEVYIAKVRG